MKVIFSRKGVDSASGKCASAIIDGKPYSLPIPTRMPTATRYHDLAPIMAALAHDLSNGGLNAERTCHLDPDIDPSALAAGRPAGWRGSLGQVSASLSHLRKKGVGPGDLFLFWGLFREAKQVGGVWRYVGPRIHAVFGCLQVECVIDLGPDGSHALEKHPWLKDHPHVRAGWSDLNAIYLARDELTFDGRKLRGYGVFDRPLVLTAPDAKMPSIWVAPRWLDVKGGGVGMTYHPEGRWLSGGRLQSAARGQEFVADVSTRSDAIKWLSQMIFEHARSRDG
jgi:hypothetical protein